jgi:ubiquinone/menaquinone biosynthesis C-methylase UbiE
MYGGFRKGKYMFPNDEAEMDRMDIYHKFFLVARRDALHTTPFIPNYDNGPRILDLGTGTGIWAIDMADKYFAQHAEVFGVDLSLIQPQS